MKKEKRKGKENLGKCENNNNLNIQKRYTTLPY
jgi:hypothetical protein